MANSRWLGRAQTQKQITTIAITGGDGDWAQNDTISLTIGGQTLTLTVGSTSTVAQILADVVDMINGGALNGDESRNTTGSLQSAWSAITADGDTSATITLTADTEGIPFTVTASATTAGAGDVGSPANSQEATGRSNVNETDNWSEGSVPGAADDVFVDDGESILYNLDSISGTLTSFTHYAKFTNDIGLAKQNDAGYTEYRTDYLTIDCSSIDIGVGDGPGSSRVKIDSGSVQTAITVHATGGEADTGTPACLLKGSHASNTLEVLGGSVGCAIYGGETAQYATILNRGSLTLGAGCTLATITQAGGLVDASSNITTLNMTGGAVIVRDAATITTATIESGVLRHDSNGTITTLNLGLYGAPAVLDLSGDTSPVTVTTLNLKKGGQIIDPHQRLTIGTFNKDGDVQSIAAG